MGSEMCIRDRGRNLEVGADAEAMEGCYLLAFFPWLAQPALLQKPRLPTQRWSHPQGAFPLDHYLRKCLTAVSHGGTFPTEAPFSVITLACVKLTHKTSQYTHEIGSYARERITFPVRAGRQREQASLFHVLYGRSQ